MYLLQGKRRNLKQVYLYLKECYTICVSVKVGSQYEPKVGVRVGKGSGLPLLIPRRLHKLMMAERRMYIAVMTLLGVHRIIPWWPPVDYSTVTEKFGGTYRTLAVEALSVSKGRICELAGVKSDIVFDRLRAVTLLPESAGPNHSIAWKGVLEDAFAIYDRPKYFYHLIKWFGLTGSYLHLFSLASLFPFWLAFRFALMARLWYFRSRVASYKFALSTLRFLEKALRLWRERLLIDYQYRQRHPWFWAGEGASLFDIKIVDWLIKLASLRPNDTVLANLVQAYYTIATKGQAGLSRVTAVYNTAGKARVIGITNYWVQIALYPLHREIFKFLEGLPTDGTYDQLKPIKALEDNNQTYYSYDLSAATDRLPRDLQKDVLSLFIGKTLSSTWASLVDMPFQVSKGGTEEIRYAVGQPMGAYSSWAMLALTHHMIIQASGDQVVKNYAVLGDDVVVSHDAPRYLELMTGFGVSISMAKSIVSNEFIEFAKRVRTIKGEDFSIIGPGLIMASVRNRFLSAVALADSIRKDIVRWTAAPKVFLEMPGRTKHIRGRGKRDTKPFDTVRGPLDYGSWVLFGPKGLISRNLSFALKEGSVRAVQDLKHESVFFKVQMREFLKRETYAKWTNSKELAAKVLNNLSTELYSIARGFKLGWPLSILLYLALWLTPIPWHIIAKYGKNLECVCPWEEKEYQTWYIDDIILDALDGFEELNISALEPLTRQEANNILRFWDGLMGFDPDAKVRQERRQADLEFAKRALEFYRHRALAAQLASEREKSQAHGTRPHGVTVPQSGQDGLKEFKPFDINDI